MELIKDGWFMEKNSLWPGQAMSLKVDKVLYNEKSDYQDILVFQSKTYGTVLVLDGVIQVTTRDEFAYQEMIAHLPLFSHADPKSVLIVGGGDGGVLREVLKHPNVKQITLCEIDRKVIEVSKKYFKNLSSGFVSEKVTIEIRDGAKFMNEHPNEFDVIIVDSSDPVGPAESLFEKPFYQGIEKCLKIGGICCSQGECIWLHVDFIYPMIQMAKDLFQRVEYAYTCIPTYPSGQIGFVLCAKGHEYLSRSLCDPVRLPTTEQQESFRYYNKEIHRAAFVLPEFARKAVEHKL